MTYRSPGRFWFPPHPPARVLLMYTRATSLFNLYIRNIIPDDMGIPSPAVLALSGWGYADFKLTSASNWGLRWRSCVDILIARGLKWSTLWNAR